MVPVFKNREFKDIFFKVLVVFIAFAIMAAFYNRYIWNELNRRIIERNIALMGNILGGYPEGTDPEFEKLVVGSFTKEVAREDINRGLAIAEKYGYSTNLPINSIPRIKNSYIKSLFGIIGLMGLQFLVVLILLYLGYGYFYHRLNQLSLGAERIMRGNFDIKFPEEGEGELPLLGFQFNQMSKRLQLTLEELRGEREMLKDMVSGISHQLKTPLASLKMFNELLLDGAAQDPGVRQEFLEKSLVQLERMEWLIQTLLKISRLEAGVVEFNKKVDDLAETLNGVVKSLEMRWKGKRQNLQIVDRTSPIPIPHDRQWMGEAFENIIKNAIDYTPEEGTIRIEVSDKDSTVEVVVADSGVGIAEKDIPHIFNRFYQGRKTRGMSKKGSGIGLALAKLIIEKHDGVINVHSKENRGTTFVITFPKGDV